MELVQRGRGIAAKLAPKYEGPYQVLKFISPNVLRLQRVGSLQRRIANLADYKAFHSGLNLTDQLDALN